MSLVSSYCSPSKGVTLLLPIAFWVRCLQERALNKVLAVIFRLMLQKTTIFYAKMLEHLPDQRTCVLWALILMLRYF